MNHKFKHGPELREFWRIQKAKYRERKKASGAKCATSTPKALDPATSQGGEPNDR